MSGRTTVLALGLLVAGLGYANWRVTQLDLDVSPGATGAMSGAESAAPVLEPPLEPRPLEDFSEIVRRPLFIAGRRPPEAPAEAAVETAAMEPAEQAPPPDFRLLGVALGSGSRQALLQPAGQPGQWIKVGGEVGGWVLKSVSADGVVLNSGERTHEVRLYPARDAASAAQ
jgi:hypothetical protein